VALDKVKFATNWLADPEAGGFFQAVADGTYAKYGLDCRMLTSQSFTGPNRSIQSLNK